MSSEVETIQKEIDELKVKLSEARRRVPPEPVRDYEFRTPDGKPIRLSDLFAGKPDLLMVHNMGKRCPYCTLWADGLNGLRRPLLSRTGFALSSPDEPAVLKAFAASRGQGVDDGWQFPMVSIAGTSFAKDMGFQDEKGGYWPGVSGFFKGADGGMVRTGRATFGPLDDFCAAWPLFDLLMGGVGAWEPRYTY